MAHSRDLDPLPTLQAHLGPTNTGKTHRAIQRMLARRTGMLGLPLRLLAREVYDRVVKRVGSGAVALVTGEERIVPPKPRYWICTVESMPVSRPVEFLGVDEIQLCDHPDRGHTFTERLLNARGLIDTWFMGSDTIRPAIEELLPTCEIHRHPRLSALRFTGETHLSDLPPRSAVVAFSGRQVYEIAERLRRRRGGAAVVLGALSPRARNAQVEMFQSGDVDYMVATDAIGMGLNMDVEHVALAALHKFDGQLLRPLRPAELAQVVGRAGRYTADGTFGTLPDAGPLDPRVAADIECHRFDPIKRLVWRNHDLDFSDLSGLQASLRARPRGRWFTAQRSAEDKETLIRLAAEPEVTERCSSPERVRLLWEVCQIPDYRKLLEGSHARLLAEVFLQLADRGELDSEWMTKRVQRHDRLDGDVGALTTRIAFIRTWAYIANRRGWLTDGTQLTELTTAIEDRLSDALHARLIWRFVDHRVGGGGVRRPTPPPTLLDGQLPGRRPDPDSPFAEMLRFPLAPDPTDESARRTSPSPEVRQDAAERAAEIIAAPDTSFTLHEARFITCSGVRVGKLSAGDTLLRPQAAALGLGPVHGATRRDVQARLQRWIRDQQERLLATVYDPADSSPPPTVRAILMALREGLGTVQAADISGRIRSLSQSDHKLLQRLGVRCGRRYVYALALLQPEAITLRSALAGAHAGLAAPPQILPGRVSAPVESGASLTYYEQTGFPVAGPRCIRVDQLERALVLLSRLGAAGPFEAPEVLMSWLGLPRKDLIPVIQGLGGHLRDDGKIDGVRVRARRKGARRRPAQPRSRRGKKTQEHW